MMTKLTAGPSLALLTLALMVAPGLSPSSAVADPPGETLPGQVAGAYEATEQYHATTQFHVHQVRGRWTIDQRADFIVAFDRPNNRLRIDKPDMLVVVADGKLRMKSDQLPGRHLEMPAPSPVTFEKVVEAVPFIVDPPVIDAVLLTAEQPWQLLSDSPGAAPATLDPAEGDAQARPRLEIQTGSGPMTLTLDPATKLVQHARVDADVQAMGGNPGDSAAMIYDVHIHAHNQPLADDLFAFDATGSTAVASMQELLNQGGGGGGQHALVNQPAPPIELRTMADEDFKLQDVEADVIVLDFWATWCPPCVEGLPKIQSVADWADEAQAFWKKHGFTMPVLMDGDGSVAAAYGVQGIPQTVVIHDGTVKHVHVGFSPDLDSTLKSQIEALLAEETAAATPAS